MATNCLYRNKFRPDLNKMETTCYDRTTGLPIDCTECDICPDNQSCWEQQFIEGGVDNTFTRLTDTNRLFTVTFDNDTVGSFTISDGNSGWSNQVIAISAGLSSIMPWAADVASYCTTGCGGLQSPIIPLSMVARYTGFRVCPGDPIPVKVTYQSDQKVTPIDLILDYNLTPIQYLDRCSDCKADEIVWKDSLTGDVLENTDVVCPRPCNADTLETPIPACNFELVEICDTDRPADTTYINFKDCGDGQVISGYLFLNADGALEEYTPNVGSIGSCGTELTSTIQCDSCGNIVEVVIYDDGITLYYTYSEKSGRGELTFPIGELGKCEGCKESIDLPVCYEAECQAFVSSNNFTPAPDTLDDITGVTVAYDQLSTGSEVILLTDSGFTWREYLEGGRLEALISALGVPFEFSYEYLNNEQTALVILKMCLTDAEGIGISFSSGDNTGTGGTETITYTDKGTLVKCLTDAPDIVLDCFGNPIKDYTLVKCPVETSDEVRDCTTVCVSGGTAGFDFTDVPRDCTKINFDTSNNAFTSICPNGWTVQDLVDVLNAGNPNGTVFEATGEVITVVSGTAPTSIWLVSTNPQIEIIMSDGGVEVCAQRVKDCNSDLQTELLQEIADNTCGVTVTSNVVCASTDQTIKLNDGTTIDLVAGQELLLGEVYDCKGNLQSFSLSVLINSVLVVIDSAVDTGQCPNPAETIPTGCIKDAKGQEWDSFQTTLNGEVVPYYQDSLTGEVGTPVGESSTWTSCGEEIECCPVARENCALINGNIVTVSYFEHPKTFELTGFRRVDTMEKLSESPQWIDCCAEPTCQQFGRVGDKWCMEEILINGISYDLTNLHGSPICSDASNIAWFDNWLLTNFGTTASYTFQGGGLETVVINSVSNFQSVTSSDLTPSVQNSNPC